MTFDVNMNDYTNSLEKRTLGGVTRESALGALARLKAAAQDAIGKLQQELEQYKGKTAQEMADLTSQKDSLELNLKQTRDAMNQQRIAHEKAESEMKAELKEAKEIAAKYAPMAKVKSVKDIGVVLPEDVEKMIDEITENQPKALQSMQDYLLTGKGQEEAIKQLERMAVIDQANRDGILNINELRDKCNKANGAGIFLQGGHTGVMNLIKSSFNGQPKATYLASRTIKEQVVQNAMGLLTPFLDERITSLSSKGTEKNLRAALDRAFAFSQNISNTKKIYANKGFTDIKDNFVPFDTLKSNITFIDREGNTRMTSYLSIYSEIL